MKNKLIYFDNAATSFPKPECVISEVINCVKSYSGNPGRSGHTLSILASEAVYSVREKIADLLDAEESDSVVLTSGATFSINLAMMSGIQKDAHILISDMEHNSVLRAAAQLQKSKGVEYSVFNSSALTEDIPRLIRKNTTHIVCTLVSNVTGECIDLETLSALSESHGLKLILDASQALGHKKISLKGVSYDALCCAGHKALFGMQGVGFAVFNRKKIGDGIVFGGSGTNSKSLDMPENLPERFEAGTLPLPAIVSLGAGIDFINFQGQENIENRLCHLTEFLLNELYCIPEIKLCSGNLGIVAFCARNMQSEELAGRLDDFGICVRGGFHCSPLMHKKLGTYDDGGAVRASLSIFNTEEEIYRFSSVLRHILTKK